MSIRDKIENNLAIWLLGTLLTGFATGVGAYRSILEIAQLKTIPLSDYNRLQRLQDAADASPHSEPSKSLSPAALTITTPPPSPPIASARTAKAHLKFRTFHARIKRLP